MRVWVDASVLIALDSIGETGLLREILGKVSITPEVQREVFNVRESRALREALGDWIEVHKVEGGLKRWQSLGLNRGEASLFLTPQTDRLVLDEAAARTVAESEGRDYIGLLGLLVAAARSGRIPAGRAREVVRRLAHSGFRMSTDLFAQVLETLEALG